MHLLAHLHGAVAAVVICSLLFADEAGVPIPVAPNEVLLILAGILIQTRAMHPLVFVPVAAVVMSAGMMSGYSWARLVGGRTIAGLARRVHAEDAYRRVQQRLSSAGPVGIGVARLIPGIRPWATLVAGASGTPMTEFLAGALPTLLLWEIVWLLLGILFGVPIARYLGVFERVLARGAILIVLGVIAYAAVRRLRASRVLTEAHMSVATPLTLAVAIGGTACLTAGTLALLRGSLHIRHYAWVDLLVVVTVVAISMSVALLRRHPHSATPSTPASRV